MIKTVSILGCGWLGFPLARRLINIGYCVKGSTTSPQKISVLKNSNIIPYQLTCSNGSIVGDNVADFFKADVLFINIPFKRDIVNPSIYVDQIRSIVPLAVQGGIQLVVFASSTLVYPMNNQIAKEEDVLVPSGARVQALIEAEQVFLKRSGLRATVIRFAGLYGPQREIAGFLKTGRVTTKDGDAPVNLVHLDDCIGIVVSVIEKNVGGEIINACGDAHPLRKDLYTHAAIAMNAKQPVFEEKKKTSYKVISNDKVKRLLGYRFIRPSPWAWIDQESKSGQ